MRLFHIFLMLISFTFIGFTLSVLLSFQLNIVVIIH